jgi:hypothetical protein
VMKNDHLSIAPLGTRLRHDQVRNENRYLGRACHIQSKAYAADPGN